jgi:hypothetical protein
MSSSSDSSSNPLDRVLVDYLKRCDEGEEIDREAFVANHPDLADELRRPLVLGAAFSPDGKNVAYSVLGRG